MHVKQTEPLTLTSSGIAVSALWCSATWAVRVERDPLLKRDKKELLDISLTHQNQSTNDSKGTALEIPFPTQRSSMFL